MSTQNGSRIVAVMNCALMLALISASLIFAQSTSRMTRRARHYTFQIVQTFPHDRSAYTQGLAYRDGFLYEGTGLNGRSSLRKVQLETGQIVQEIDLGAQFFGEGVTLLGNEVWQLTWKSQIGFVYTSADFHLLRRFSYAGEGWGLATDGKQVFMSDGTSQLRALDPRTSSETHRIDVQDGGTPVRLLNELEFVEGEIFANVWQTDQIVRISPETGEVLGWIDLTGLLSPVYRMGSEDVLNGIAYDASRKRLFVTGKLWPNVFEIRLLPQKTPR